MLNDRQIGAVNLHEHHHQLSGLAISRIGRSFGQVGMAANFALPRV